MYLLLQYQEFTDAVKEVWRGQAQAPATSDLKVSMKFDPTTVKLQDELKVKVGGAAPPTEQATSPGETQPYGPALCQGICYNNEVYYT